MTCTLIVHRIKGSVRLIFRISIAAGMSQVDTTHCATDYLAVSGFGEQSTNAYVNERGEKGIFLAKQRPDNSTARAPE